MCGRYRIKDTDELTQHLRRTFGIPEWVEDQNRPRYNIAPTQEVPIVRREHDSDVVVPVFMRWGFVPFWEKSAKPKLAPINAQAEKVATSPMFRQSFQKRRCLVPADGFYEWLRLDEKTKVPFDVHLKDNHSFFMAGLFEGPTELRPATFTVLTTRANELVSKIHDRMPVILHDDEAQHWLQRGPLTAEELAQLTAPFPAEEMAATPISTLVNNPRNDTPEILEPVAFERPPQRMDEG